HAPRRRGLPRGRGGRPAARPRPAVPGPGVARRAGGGGRGMKGPVTVFRDIAELVTVSGHQGPAAGPRQAEIGLIRDAYLAVGADGRVLEAGPMADLPRFDGPVETIDCSGCTVTPGFVDPHTHAVFGGWRADEFVLRLGGARYEEILAAGGG